MDLEGGISNRVLCDNLRNDAKSDVGTSMGDVLRLGLVTHMIKALSARLATLSRLQWKPRCVSLPF